MSEIKSSVIEIDVYARAGLPQPGPEQDAEFRRLFGRDPDESDRMLGLSEVIHTARQIDGYSMDQLVCLLEVES